MSAQRSVVINGDLGSGKSTVSTLLARRLGVRRISVGELYRQIARQRGLTALELNLHAELDDEIDGYVDQLQRDIARSAQPLVVDSRLAWLFFRDAMKVHLVTDPLVAAHRVLDRPADTVESYASAAEALRRLTERSESERLRFIERYGVDKARLRNYDLVCDTTSAPAEEVVARIVATLRAPPSELRLYVDPGRIHLLPGTVAGSAAGSVAGSVAGSAAGTGPIRLGYSRPHFFAVGGEDAIRAAAQAGQPLVPATLAAEADELLDGRTAADFAASLVSG